MTLGARVRSLNAESIRARQASGREEEEQMRRALFGVMFVALLAVFVAVTPGAARADGADVTTVVQQNATRSDAFTNPCGGESGTVDLTYTSIFHLTERPNNTFNLTINESGYFTFTTSSSVITGHYVTVFVLAGGRNDVETALIIGRGTASDGSPFTITHLAHLTEAASGFTLSFDRCL